MRPTHIKSLGQILAALESPSLRLTPHDLRRTVASALAINTHALSVVAGALNHAEGNNHNYSQTLDYIQTKVEMLRDAYEKHETRVRTWAGLEPAAAAASSHSPQAAAILLVRGT